MQYIQLEKLMDLKQWGHVRMENYCPLVTEQTFLSAVKSLNMVFFQQPGCFPGLKGGEISRFKCSWSSSLVKDYMSRLQFYSLNMKPLLKLEIWASFYITAFYTREIITFKTTILIFGKPFLWLIELITAL